MPHRVPDRRDGKPCDGDHNPPTVRLRLSQSIPAKATHCGGEKNCIILTTNDKTVLIGVGEWGGRGGETRRETVTILKILKAMLIIIRNMKVKRE